MGLLISWLKWLHFCDVIDLPIPKNVSDWFVLLKNLMLKKWQKLWDENTKGRFYYRLQPTVSTEIKYTDPVRSKETLLSRLRFGKCFLADTLKLVGKKPDILCDKCHVKEDVSHFLLNCNKYEDHIVERNDKILAYNRIISVETLLGDPPCYIDVFEYVIKTGRNI